MEKSYARTVDNWGNSLGVRLPKQYCDWLHLDVGTQVEIELDNGQKCLIIRKK